VILSFFSPFVLQVPNEIDSGDKNTKNQCKIQFLGIFYHARVNSMKKKNNEQKYGCTCQLNLKPASSHQQRYALFGKSVQYATNQSMNCQLETRKEHKTPLTTLCHDKNNN